MRGNIVRQECDEAPLHHSKVERLMTAGNFKNEKQVGQKRAKNMNVL